MPFFKMEKIVGMDFPVRKLLKNDILCPVRKLSRLIGFQTIFLDLHAFAGVKQNEQRLREVRSMFQGF